MREEIRRLFILGDYQAVVEKCDEALNNLKATEGNSLLARQILNEQSRAFRNMGHIQRALECNISALNSAHNAGDHLDEAWQLVQLGKIFGKYLERQTLFSACLKEAERRYQDLLEVEPTAPGLLVRAAIVKDLMGSYYRRIAERGGENRLKCEDAYSQAISLHQSACNPEGVSRATCHLAYARAYFAHIDRDLSGFEKKQKLREALLLFEKGVRRVLSLDEAARGRATRLAQQAHIFLMLDNYDHALRLLPESILLAQSRNDPRGVLLARRILGLAYLAIGKHREAAIEFEESRAIAHGMKFSGLERRVLSELAEAYLQLDDPQRAIQVLQYNDELVEHELLDFNSGLHGAFEILERVAPERAERYIREGQRQDYEILISELINNGRLLRSLFSSYERMRSLELQSAIHRFAKSSLRHAIKDPLQNIAMRLLDARLRLEEAHAADERTGQLFSDAQEAIAAIRNLLGTDTDGHAPGPASLGHELAVLVRQYFTIKEARVDMLRDVVFPGLLPSLLREALRHLIENAVAATSLYPPSDGDLRLLVTQDLESDGGMTVRIMNAGENPKAGPSDDPSIGPIHVHGFPNARWFFRQVLGFDCDFLLREDGPRSLPHRSNCVEIRIPAPGAIPIQYSFIPFVGSHAS